MDYTEQKSRIQQFDEMHGNFILMDGGSWLLFQDGAMRQSNRDGLLQEPSPDPCVRLKAILKFWSIKLQLAVQEFDAVKNQHLMLIRSKLKIVGNPGGTDSSAAIEALKKLQEKVNFLQCKVNITTKELARSTPLNVSMRKSLERENRARIAQAMKAIEKIEI